MKLQLCKLILEVSILMSYFWAELTDVARVEFRWCCRTVFKHRCYL